MILHLEGEDAGQSLQLKVDSGLHRRSMFHLVNLFISHFLIPRKENADIASRLIIAMGSGGEIKILVEVLGHDGVSPITCY